MRYQGGKARQGKIIASYILPHITDDMFYYEPFVGGANVLYHMAKHPHIVASDNSLDLILLYQELQRGWEPPNEITEEDYKILQYSSPSPLRGYAGYVASWGGKFFGGYARGGGRNWVDEGRRGLLKYFQKLGHVTFIHGDYQHIGTTVPSNSIIYCDPPYATTERYRDEAFNHDVFWQWVESMSYHSVVFVSEFTTPESGEIIHEWERMVKRGIKHAYYATEKLVKFDRRFSKIKAISEAIPSITLSQHSQ